MANLKDIRSRITTTKNTQQITKAMKLVSASKLRRAQQSVVGQRPYSNGLRRMIEHIAEMQSISHPLMKVSEGKKVLLVVITSDRGLCGAFNAASIKAAIQTYTKLTADGKEVGVLFIGKKGAEAFRKRLRVEPYDVIYNLAKEISPLLAGGLADRLSKAFLEGQFDEVLVVYNEFFSAIRQEPRVEKVLPIDSGATGQIGLPDSARAQQERQIIFEPSPAEILEQLLAKYLAVRVFRVMSESMASEHGARMTAMENATKNAGQMIADLTLTYNKVRQASITTELIEITSGAEALRG